MIVTGRIRRTLRKSSLCSTLFTTDPTWAVLGLNLYFQKTKGHWNKCKIRVSTTESKFMCLWCTLRLAFGTYQDQVFGVQSRYTWKSERNVKELKWKGDSRYVATSEVAKNLGACLVHNNNNKSINYCQIMYLQMLLLLDTLIRTAFCTSQYSDAKNREYSVCCREE
jgi:hypothetical protein